MEQEKWKISKPLGGCISKTKSVFTEGNKYLVVAAGNRVCGYSVETGVECMAYSHKSPVVRIAEVAPGRVLSVCRSGLIKEASLAEGKVLATANMHRRVWKGAYSGHTRTLYLLENKERNTEARGVRVFKGGSVELAETIELGDVLGVCKQVEVSDSGKLLALLIGKTLLYCDLERKSGGGAAEGTRGVVRRCRELVHEVDLISAAISPHDAIIATGDITGKLSLWHTSEKSKAAKSTFHWHAHALESLAYSPDGSILYSGGREGVVVLWHNNTNSHSYVPHFQSRISSLSCSADGTLLSVTHFNNTVTILNTATLKIVQSIIHLYFVPEHLAVARDPRRHLAFGSDGGLLQFFDPSSRKIIQLLDVSSKNYSAPTFSENSFPLRITHVCFSQSAPHSLSEDDWLLTVEQMESSGIISHSLTQLKFWKRSESSHYSLKALVSDNHKRVHLASSRNSKCPSFVTVGSDNCFMVWEYRMAESQQSWQCSIIGSYKEYRILQLHASVLGQLKFVHEENLVSCWDGAANLAGAHKMNVKEETHSAAFSTDGQYVLGLTLSRAYSFSIEFSQVLWELKLAANSVCNDPWNESRCAVVLRGEKSQCILLLNYKASAPITICKFKGASNKIVRIMFADLGKYKRSTLVVFKSNGQIQKLSSVTEEELKTADAELHSPRFLLEESKGVESVVEGKSAKQVSGEWMGEERVRGQVMRLNKGLMERCLHDAPDGLMNLLFESLMIGGEAGSSKREAEAMVENAVGEVNYDVLGGEEEKMVDIGREVMAADEAQQEEELSDLSIIL